MPNPCGSDKNVVPNTPPILILVTVHTFHPELCHKGIENATVTRMAFLSGPLPVAVDPRKQHDDDDHHHHDDADDDGDDDDDDDDDDDSKHPGRPKPRSTPHHRSSQGRRADPDPEPHTTPSRPKSRTTLHYVGTPPTPPPPSYPPPPPTKWSKSSWGSRFCLKSGNSRRDGPPEPGILMSVVTFEAMQLRGVSKVATLSWTGHGFGLCCAQLLTLNPKSVHISACKP